MLALRFAAAELGLGAFGKRVYELARFSEHLLLKERPRLAHVDGLHDAARFVVLGLRPLQVLAAVQVDVFEDRGGEQVGRSRVRRAFVLVS